MNYFLRYYKSFMFWRVKNQQPKTFSDNFKNNNDDLTEILLWYC